MREKIKREKRRNLTGDGILGNTGMNGRIRNFVFRKRLQYETDKIAWQILMAFVEASAGLD